MQEAIQRKKPYFVRKVNELVKNDPKTLSMVWVTTKRGSPRH